MARDPNSQRGSWPGLTPPQSLRGILFPHLSNGDNNLGLSYCQQLLGTLPSTLVSLSLFSFPKLPILQMRKLKRRG